MLWSLHLIIKVIFNRSEKKALDCMYAISNSTVDYAGHTYTAPCKPMLLSQPQLVEDAREDVIYAYKTLCHNDDVSYYYIFFIV